jgi:hypothetical protein
MGMDDRLMQDYETTLDAGSLIILIILLAFESAYCCSRSVWGGEVGASPLSLSRRMDVVITVLLGARAAQRAAGGLHSTTPTCIQATYF